MCHGVRKSRCETPSESGYIWINLIEASNKSVQELNKSVESLGEYSQAEVIGAIVALRQRAAQGLILKKDNEIENIRLFPELFELKWSFNFSGRRLEIRQYHGEPQEVRDGLIALHIHEKRLGGSNVQIRSWQNREIAVARKRFSSWKFPRV